MRIGLPLSSVSAKILVAFLAMLGAFGGVTAYTAVTMRRLGTELRRISRGYLNLRLGVQELQTHQDNLLNLLERPPEDTDPQRAREDAAAHLARAREDAATHAPRSREDAATHAPRSREDAAAHPAPAPRRVFAPPAPEFIKSAVDTARTFRRAELHRVEELVAGLRSTEPAADEEDFLRGVSERLGAIDQTFVEDEALFDEVYGPLRTRPAPPPPPAGIDERERLLRREERLLRDFRDLSQKLRGRVVVAELQLEADERRAVYAILLLTAIAALCGLGVMALAQRALAPLRRLAASAKQLARGDLKQRVEVDSSDEIGALAREFNAMAAALEEREQRLIRSERLAAVGKIAAQITHEVRNPLSSIGLNAELIQEELGALERAAGKGAAGEARELTAAIIKEVDRLAEITEQYLRLARLPRPRLEGEDVNAIVSSLLAFVREELGGRGIAVEARLGERLPPVPADESQLRQALLNLLRNAAEAMPSGGRLTVETSCAAAGGDGGAGGAPDDDRPVRVVIADTGEGIPVEIRGKIFEPFFSTKAGGTGLGLALTQQIVVEHGGAIEVESEPGRGTRFVVRLPAASAPATAAADVPAAPRSATLGP